MGPRFTIEYFNIPNGWIYLWGGDSLLALLWQIYKASKSHKVVRVML